MAVVMEDFDRLFDDLSKTSIRVLEVFVNTHRGTSPDDMLKMAWKCLGAVPSSTTQVRVGLSETCTSYLVAQGMDHTAANWPLLTKALKSQSRHVSVQFWEWVASSTALRMADPIALPSDISMPSPCELAHIFRPFRGSFRSGLAERLEHVSSGACVEIPQ